MIAVSALVVAGVGVLVWRYMAEAGGAGAVSASLAAYFNAREKGVPADEALAVMIDARLADDAATRQRLHARLQELADRQPDEEARVKAMVLATVAAASSSPAAEEPKLRESIDHLYRRMARRAEARARAKDAQQDKAYTPEGQEIVRQKCPECGADPGHRYRCPECGHLVLP